MTVGRITNAMLTQQVLANINQSQNAMQTTEQEMSTGKKINLPSDDPYGASLAVSLNGQLARLSDYSSNVSDGQAWTSAGLSALSNITSETQRAATLVTGALNGTQSATDLQADGAEIEQLIAGIKSDANAQYNGQYVFAGGSTTPPYDTSSTASSANLYQGAGAATMRTVGPNQPVQVSAQLSIVLNGGTGSSTDNSGLLSQLRSIADALNAGVAPGQDALTQLQSSLNGLTQQSTTLGAASERLTMSATRIQTLQTSTTSALSDDQDADYASTALQFSNQQAAFQAALKAGASIVQSSLMDFLSTS